MVFTVICGFELLVKSRFEQAFETLSQRLEQSEATQKNHLTNLQVADLLGKKPEFQGDPGQIESSSHYYEIYVWRSLLKSNFIAPPQNPEILDLLALYSGEVRPDRIKYRTPEKPLAQGFFAAYTIYVYYGAPDPKTNAREVIDIQLERKKYSDEIRIPPTAEELAKFHKENLAAAVAGAQKGRPPLTTEQIEKLDNWKNPAPYSTNNTDLIPKFRHGEKSVSAEDESFAAPPKKPTEAAERTPSPRESDTKKSVSGER